MITNANQIIPRKKGFFSANYLMVIVYIAIIAAVIYFDEDLIIWFVLAFLVISIPAAFISQRLLRARWEQLAGQTNLAFETGGMFGMFSNPQLKGRYRGYGVVLDTFARGSSRSRRYYTRFSIAFPFENPDSFSLQKHRFYHTNKLQIEDHEISMKYTFKADSPRPIDRLLRHNRIRQSLLDLHPQVRSLEFQVSEQGIVFVERGRINDPAYLQAVLNFLTHLSDLIKQHTQGFDFDRGE